MERAGGARRGASCHSHTGRADRQADQRRISKRLFDAACEYHDAGTFDGNGIAAARAFGCSADHAVTAARRTDVADSTGIADSRSRQETAGAKTRARSDTCAGHISASSRASAVRFLGLIPR